MTPKSYCTKFKVILQENASFLLDGQDCIRKLHRHDVTTSRVHSIVDENSAKKDAFALNDGLINKSARVWPCAMLYLSPPRPGVNMATEESLR